MAAESENDSQLEIAHVLFTDIVGYSKLPINKQSELVRQLNQAVKSTEQFRRADAAGKLIRIATGDGMALAFFTSPDAPLRCAIELSKANGETSALQLRMGIHSGPVDQLADVNERSNLAGSGMNMAQRVMDLGDAGHILLSKRVADDLGQYEKWQPLLHNLGEVEVKHGVKIDIFNFHGDGIGNPAVPEKIAQGMRDRDVAARSVAKRSRIKRRSIAVISLLTTAIAIGLSLFAYRTTRKLADVTRLRNLASLIPDKSIAVLPFQNMSEDKANAYFADGVQEEILTTLAKVADLKVISRTSVMQFRDAEKRSLRDIAQQLGVAHVLEGSVQRVATRVRVTAQLVNARTDSHVWADQFDGELADVFAIQSEIAQKIATQLKAALSPKEQAALEAKPTLDLAAYDLYLRAREIGRSSALEATEGEWIQKQVTLLEGAVARDPAFVPALCQLAFAHLEAYWWNHDHTPKRLELARTAIEAAARLQPDAGEVHRARAQFYYWGHRDYAPALAELALARRSLPNDADVLVFQGAVARRQGHWEQSIRTTEDGLVLDPRNPRIAGELARAYHALRRYAEERRILNNNLTWKPEEFSFHVDQASIDLSANADPGALRNVAFGEVAKKAEPDEAADVQLSVALAERDYHAAEQALSAYRQPDFSWEGFLTPREYQEGRVARGLGDTNRAKAAFSAARNRAAEAVSAHGLRRRKP